MQKVFFNPQRYFFPSCFQSLLLAAVFIEVLVSSALPPPSSPTTPPNAHAPLLRSHNSAVTWQRGPSWTRHQPRCHGNTTHTRRHGKHVGFSRSQSYTHNKTHMCIQLWVLQHPSKRNDASINQSGGDRQCNLLCTCNIFTSVFHGRNRGKKGKIWSDVMDC